MSKLDRLVAAKVDGSISPEGDAELTKHPEAAALVEQTAATHKQIAEAFEKSKPDAELESRILQAFLQRTSKQPQDFLLLRKEPDSFWKMVLTIAVPSIVMLFLGMGLSRLVIGDDRPLWTQPGKEKPQNEGLELGMPSPEGSEATSSDNAVLPTEPGARVDALLRRRKDFRDAEFTIDVASWKNTESAVHQAVQLAQGKMEISEAKRQPNGRIKGEIIARVPDGQKEPLLQTLSALGEVRTRRDAVSETQNFHEAETRLSALVATEDRLKGLAEQAKTNPETMADLEMDLSDVRQSIARTRQALAEWAALKDSACVEVSVLEADPSDPAYRLEETVQLTILTPHVRQVFDELMVLPGMQLLDTTLAQDGDAAVSGLIDLQAEPGKAQALLESISKLGRMRDLNRKNTRTAVNAGSALANDRTDTAPIRMRLRIELDDRAEKNITLNLYSERVEETCERVKFAVTSAGGTVLASAVSDADTDAASAAMRIRLYSDREAATLAEIRNFGYQSTLDIARDTSSPGQFYPVLVELNIRSHTAPIRQTVLDFDTTDVAESIRQIKEAAKEAAFVVYRANYESTNGMGTGTMVLRGPENRETELLARLKKLGGIGKGSSKGEELGTPSEKTSVEIELRLRKPNPKQIEVTFGDAFSMNLLEGLKSIGKTFKSLAIGAAYVLPWAVIAWLGLWMIKRRFRH